MCLLLLSCLLLVKQIFSDQTTLTARSGCSSSSSSSTRHTCTQSANLAQRDLNILRTLVSEEESPDIQRRVDARDTLGSASTPQSSVKESDVEKEFVNPRVIGSGEVHQKGAQSTLVATRAFNDAPLVSPSEKLGTVSENEHIKAHVESPAASFAFLHTSIQANSGEARLEENVENASAKGRAGFSELVFRWLQAVSRESIVGVLRLHPPGAHIVPIVLPTVLILVLIVCCVIFFSSGPVSEQTVNGVPEVKQARHFYTEILASPRSPGSLPHEKHTSQLPSCFSPSVSEKSSPLVSERGQGEPGKNHLCPELVVPPASMCTLVVPELSARIFQESEATLTICNTMGDRLLYVSLSKATAESPDHREFGNMSNLRLSLNAVHDDTTYAFCEIRLHGHMPGAGATGRITVVFLDSAGKYFAELWPLTEAGEKDHYKVSTTQGWDISWRGTGPKTAVDSDGRRLAKVHCKVSGETRHTVTGGSGVDMGLILLSLLGIDLFAEIDRGGF